MDASLEGTRHRLIMTQGGFSFEHSDIAY